MTMPNKPEPPMNSKLPKPNTTNSELETQLWQDYQLTHQQAKDVAALIASEVREARIDELENGMLINTNSPAILNNYIRDRLSSLQSREQDNE